MTLKRKYDWKFTLAAFIATIALMVPSTYVHELGHGAICKAEGYDFTYSVGLQGGILECPGIETTESQATILWFYFMGGGTAALVFFAIGIFGTFTDIRLLRPLAVTGMTIASSNFMVAILETFAHEFYMTASPFVVLAINFVGFMLWFGFVLYYHPKREVLEQTQ